MDSDLSSCGSSNHSRPDVALAQLRHHNRNRGPAQPPGQTSRSSHNTHPVTPACLPGALPPHVASMINGTPIAMKTSACSPFISNHYYDSEEFKPALLKDTWRVDLPGIEKEGETIKELHKKHVPHIPKIICATDLHQVRPSFADNHRMCTHLYAASEPFERQEVWPEIEGLRPHTHYRIVLKTIGISLMDFKSSRQLVTAARDALRALAAAFHNAKILHRDISCGNILIVKTGGLLIDWDMAKRVPAANPKEADDPSKPGNSNATDVNAQTSPIACIPRQIERSGTWRFMSARLLLPLNSDVPPHTLADDMESLLHVLIWIAMRCMPHNLAPGVLSDNLHNIFDRYSIIGTEMRGGSGKEFFLLTREIGNIGLKDPVLVNLLKDLSAIFAVQYEGAPDEDTSKILRQIDAGEPSEAVLSESDRDLLCIARIYRRRQRQREDSAWILGLFERALKDARWPNDDDESAENKFPPKLDHGLKRKAPDTIDENERTVVKQKPIMIDRNAHSTARQNGSRD
ncbi:hypothetical protein Hypma_013872 [Hypsizygus marmoreus]|uniref:Fungal-type protein kinase domain-containing protein n=1 Tax=Hypsizygus marmoreus TaxID=39966 RepID=A0A369KDI9_HYPMA|nr:hypothetical protein Hypma_013872 [Hypsizygus marmoreus]